jgi:hypothetical protein
MTQGNLFDATPTPGLSGPAHVVENLMACADRVGAPPPVQRIVSWVDREVKGETHTFVEVIMFDGVPATLQVFPNGKIGKRVHWGGYWVYNPGGDIEFKNGRWQRCVTRRKPLKA